MEASFIHLRVHSEFSICDSLLSIKKIVAAAKSNNMPAIAITDENNLFGLVKFYREARSQGIKPLIGADIWVIAEGNPYRLTLLCQNQLGYKNLTKILSLAYIEGQTKDATPIVAESWLRSSHEGLLVLSGGIDGDVGRLIVKGDIKSAEQKLLKWRSLLQDRYYIEASRIDHQNEAVYFAGVSMLADQHQIPMVATNPACFLQQDDFEAHEARVCIQSGYVLDDMKRPKKHTDKQYFRSTAQMQELFADRVDLLANTVVIAKRCNCEIELGKAYLPDFPIDEKISLAEYLKKISFAALDKRFAKIQSISSHSLEAYKERLNIELDVINRMGFPGYFLIVADFIEWSKSNGVPVGPGRGSGAGSLVAFVLGITMLDPLHHELLFERFLNPERVSMPDFDVDFCMEGRDRVIAYVAEKYGHDAVSQIITYGTMAAKAVVRDVGRVLSLPYGFVDRIAKLIPFEIGITLEKALEQEDQLSELYREDGEVATLIDLAKKLEGLTRNAGKHAGGVVIAPTKLIDFSPLYCEPNASDHAVTQFDKDDVEAVGLVKFDFLGLRTLTIINWALQNINAQRKLNSESPLDIDEIPVADKLTFDLLKACETTAVFQLESRGMKDLIRRLQPDDFEEITALVALFRPGPLQSGMVDDFIDRKHGRAKVLYPHPLSEKVLQPTYGVILYQEQVMQLAQVLAGYSLGGADLLRRAMGKKKPEEMAKQRSIFTDGALANGIDHDTSTAIFDLIEKFAGYGFNKSHSAAYALIAYQTAYLKAHYPAEFMAAVLSSDMDNTDKVVGFIEECKIMGIKVLPPNINYSDYHFTVNSDGDIRYGLGAIKGAGQAAMLHLVDMRNKQGKYSNLFELTRRLENKKIGKRVLEPLVRSGACDDFTSHRASLFSSIALALKAAAQYSKNNTLGQDDLFASSDAASSVMDMDYCTCSPWSQAELLLGEKTTLGYYLSGHPLLSYAGEIAQLSSLKLNMLSDKMSQTVTVVGIVVAIRTILTRKGKRMCIVQLEDETSRVDITLFSKLYESILRELHTDETYMVTAKVELDDFNGGVRLVADSMEALAVVRQKRAQALRVTLSSTLDFSKIIPSLKSILLPCCGGSCQVVIAYQAHDVQGDFRLGSQWQVSLDSSLIHALEGELGVDSVAIDYF